LETPIQQPAVGLEKEKKSNKTAESPQKEWQRFYNETAEVIDELIDSVTEPFYACEADCTTAGYSCKCFRG